jgi:Kef-type K+ transport system membrane component KefB
MITGVYEIAILVTLAAVLSTLAHILKQPVVLAYLATGALIGAFHFLNFGTQPGLSLFSDLGIMFLLFLVGLEVNYTSLRHVGKASVIVGIGQLIVTFIIGFLLATAFHMPVIPAAYISIALTDRKSVV